MRILNRLIAAGVLVVPMALGVSGVAVADIAADRSVLPTQIGASDNDGSDRSDDCDDKGGFLGILGGGDKSDDGKCKGKDRDNSNGLLD
ncbi:MAG: hypothetical protein ACRDTA_20255 [Pseudonocardiaceae bacterium]